MPNTEETTGRAPVQELAESQVAAAPETPAADAPPTAGVADALPSTEELLRAAELRAAEHHDAWLRAKAETENVRRRAQEDVAKAAKFATEKFAQAMLPVKDSLEVPGEQRGQGLTETNVVGAAVEPDARRPESVHIEVRVAGPGLPDPRFLR